MAMFTNKFPHFDLNLIKIPHFDLNCGHDILFVLNYLLIFKIVTNKIFLCKCKKVFEYYLKYISKNLICFLN